MRSLAKKGGNAVRCFSTIVPVNIPLSLVNEFEKRCDRALADLPKFSLGFNWEEEDGRSLAQYQQRMRKQIASSQNISLASAEFTKFIEESSDPECKKIKEEMDKFMRDPTRSVIAFSNLPTKSFAHTDLFTRILCDQMGYHPFSYVGIKQDGEVRKIDESSALIERRTAFSPHNDYRFRRDATKPDLVTFACVSRINLESQKCETFFIEAEEIYQDLSPKNQEILSSPIISYCGPLRDGYSENNSEPGGVFYFDEKGIRRICYDREMLNAVLGDEGVISEKDFSKEEIQSAFLELEDVTKRLSLNRQRRHDIDLLVGQAILFRNYAGLHGREDEVGGDSYRALVHHLHSEIKPQQAEKITSDKSKGGNLPPPPPRK